MTEASRWLVVVATSVVLIYVLLPGGARLIVWLAQRLLRRPLDEAHDEAHVHTNSRAEARPELDARVLVVGCPHCHALPARRCVTPSGRSTASHRARHHEYYRHIKRQRLEELRAEGRAAREASLPDRAVYLEEDEER